MQSRVRPLFAARALAARALAPWASLARAALLSIGVLCSGSYAQASYAQASSGQASSGQDRVVNVGVLTDMAGIYRDFSGLGSAEAARMAVEDFGGEVLNTPIQVFLADHGNDVPTGVAIATEWLDKKRVGAIVDMPHSPVALAVRRLVAAHKRIDIVVSGGSTELTGAACSETGFHWAYDTYSNSVPMVRAMVGFRLNSWFFITVENAFGLSLEQDASSAVSAAGGKVVGHARHPLNAGNFGRHLSAAQDSGARVIALANAGGDAIETIREAAELGISSRSQALAPLLVFLTDIHTLGLDIAKGMTFIDGFYWNADPDSRAWSKRFFARVGVMPTMTHAGVYSAVRHYLRAVKAAGTDDAAIVAAKMRELPVDDFFAKGGRIRADGRLVHDLYLVQVKQPAQSRQPWDYYDILSTIPGAKAFRPLDESVCPLVRN
jgi:branched-chain amino acid transport system substrate-binding protein